MNKYKAQARAARKQRKKQRMCESKVRFETEAAAFQKGQRSYLCPHCLGWHRSGALASFIADLKK